MNVDIRPEEQAAHSPSAQSGPEARTKMGAGSLSYLQLALVTFFVGMISLEVQGMHIQGMNLANIALIGSMLLTICFRLVTPWRKGFSWFRLTGQDYVILVTILVYAMSAAYSPERTETLVQSFILLVIWMAVLSLSTFPTRRIIRAYVHACIWVAVLSLLLLASPEHAFQERSSTGLPEFRGIFFHQLRLGLFMAVGFAFMVLAWLNNEHGYVIHRNRLAALAMFVLVTICMLASLARSNIAFMIIALPLSIGLSRRGWIRGVTVIMALLIAVLIIYFSDSILSSVTDDDGSISLLSGRAMVWERTWAVASESPLFGYGYGSFTAHHFDSMWNDYRAPHAHNSFLQAFFENGIIGVGLLCALIFVQISSCMRAIRSRRYSYALFVIVIAVLSSLTGVTYAGRVTILYLMLLLLVETETSKAVKI